MPTTAPAAPCVDTQRLVAGYLPESCPDRALEGTPILPPRLRERHRATASPGHKRPPPAYSGLAPAGPDAASTLIWVPRALFFPAYLTVEYGLRWPIVKLITLSEKHHVFSKVKDFFTFNDGKGGLYPTLFFDFGLSPSMGLYFYHDDLGFRTNRLVLQVGAWPTGGWVHLVADDSFKVFEADAGTVDLHAEFIHRPDFVFAGLGPEALSEKHFFRLQQTEVGIGLDSVLKNMNRASLELVYKNVAISRGDSPSVDDPTSPLAQDLANLAPGFGTRFNIISARVELVLDTRSPERAYTPGSGLRLELFGDINLDPAEVELSYSHYGGEAAAFWDISGVNHVLALRFHVALLQRIGDATIPLTERIMLGGAEVMRGFLKGWLRGDSAMAATLDYRYPVHSLVDANLFISVGNVFMGRFEQLHAKRLRMSWGAGLRSNFSREVSLDLMVAFGTNTMQRWSDGFAIDHTRVLLGVNQGF